MALKIRMARRGRKGIPFYSIVIADSRSPRDGRFIEKVGTYNPLLKNDDPNRVVLVKERIQHWIKQGATPSDRVEIFLAKAGMVPMPKWTESPKKSAPKAKAQERLKEKEEKARKAAEAASAPPPAEAPAEESAPEAAAAEA
ncbi:MAG TPA: 30S ribosomal protein S16 [Alphaproteobacteria bacterium]|nr:30S ribosomal protein S16 [Alphaproteobacteria bacterium]